MTWPNFVNVRPGASPREAYLTRAAVWLTFGAAASIVVSIFVSQTLLWPAVAALLLCGAKLRLPRIKLPLALFILGTVTSLAFSGEIVHGLPQIRKLLVFLMLLAVCSCLRNSVVVRWLFLTWAVLGAVAGLLGVAQFLVKLEDARRAGVSFEPYYTAERITGFMSHWNTFSEEEMFILLMLCAFLFFAPVARKRMWIWLTCAALLGVALILGETRGVWFATVFGGLYLVWFWRPKLVLLVPVVVAALLFTPVVGDRVRSIIHPAQSDSNTFRKIAWRTGIEMIKRHPLLGLGPDGPKFHFPEYIPADIPRPLPEGFYQHVHNVYLQYAADRGIPTALMMVWLLVQTVVDFWRGLRRLPPGPSTRKFLLHGGIAVVLATMVDGVVEYNLGDTEFLTMFLVVVGCGYLALERDLIEDRLA
jgi:putative inorganic carbon (hco3(-)) transporter